MRATLCTLLGLGLSVSGFQVAAPTVAHAAAVADNPEQLYNDGRKAYRLGKFTEAIDKWEKGYGLSDNPLFLYNISLAYRERYRAAKKAERKVDDLHKARAVMDNFVKLAEADPEIDPDDAPQILVELDQMIEKAEADAALEPDPVPKPAPPRDTTPKGKDPGRPLRIAGGVTMAVGGAVTIASVIVGAVYAAQSAEFSSKLQDSTNVLNSTDCEGLDPDPVMWQEAGADGSLLGDDDPQECYQAAIDADHFRQLGRDRNRQAPLWFAVGGSLGVATLITGAVLFAVGNRRTRAWERGLAGRIRIVPTWRGIGIAGRF